MSGEALLKTWAAPARRAALVRLAGWSVPIAVAAVALAWRVGGGGWAAAIFAFAVLVVAVAGRAVARRYDRDWLVRTLDARRDELEDSTDLLFATALPPLQALQRDRIATRLAAVAPTALEPARPKAALAAVWVVALAAAGAALFWPPSHDADAPLFPAASGPAGTPGAARLSGQRVRIIPPAYTGLPSRDVGTLDLRAPAGSRIEWTLAFAPEPAAAALRLLDGAHIPLAHGGARWRAGVRLDRSLLYRIVADGAPGTPPLHRLEAVADAPPQVRLVEPAEGLAQMRAGQRRWRVMFEATDDYGVAASAQLKLTIAQGEGENVTFRERAMTVRGTGEARRRRFVADLDLGGLGFQPGGDLVAQLTVSDLRQPDPHVVHGPGAILRWPAKLGEGPSGLELMSQRVLPAYFRSQRQIIIDAEALIPQRRRLASDAFVEKSDAIGVDQRLLRLRYGQFLGEEAEGGPKRPALPTNDAPNDPEPAHAPDDGHDHDGEASTSAPTVFGQAGNVTAEFGHTHDEREAATLLDPDTRATLKQALDQMWQSELNLRQGKPDQALPYAYKALAFIKQVQQATRVFLARVGPQLPPLDLSRRMTGKREGLASRPAGIDAVEPGDGAVVAAWRGLAGGAVDLAPLDRWVRANEARVHDPLSLLAAIDGVRAAPSCASCRERLRGQLWTVLSRPPAQVRRRDDGGAVGRRYVRGLR